MDYKEVLNQIYFEKNILQQLQNQQNCFLERILLWYTSLKTTMNNHTQYAYSET